LTSTLTGGGQSGGTIVVPSGTAVSDQATLSGANAASATGTVTYTALGSVTSPFFGFQPFGDAAWDNWFLEPVSDAGTVTVTGGAVPPSNAIVLGAGVYFWVARYSGDSLNAPSSATTGIATEIVEAPTICPIDLGWLSVRGFAGREGPAGIGRATTGSGNAGSEDTGVGNSGASGYGGYHWDGFGGDGRGGGLGYGRGGERGYGGASWGYG